MHADVPESAARRALVSVDSAWNKVTLGLELMLRSTFEGERQIPWIFTSGWLRKRAAVIRRAILPVKPAMAMVVIAVVADILLL